MLVPIEILSINWAEISKLLFGTAMDENVKDLRYHYVRLITIANIRKLVKLYSNLNELLLHAKEIKLIA